VERKARRRGMRRWRVLSLLPALLAAGCSPVRLINAMAPRDFLLTADQPYGPEPRQQMDIYRPVDLAAAAPVVLFFYGGNWQSGERADYLFLGQALASRGFVAVIVDYRLYPAVRYPAFIEDGAAAVRWVHEHAGAFGGNPERLYVMGHSAGAYIAAMLSIDARWLGADRAKIRGMIGLAGPYDFLPLHDPALKEMFGPESELPQTQPIVYVDGSAPPMLLLSGATDLTVWPSNSRRLADRIRTKGGVVEERYYTGLGHVTLIGALARPLRMVTPVLDDIAAFIGR
jgi:acetyl esterase/lipase